MSRFTDTAGRPAWIRETERCRYFDGIGGGEKTCKAGVEYASVKDPDKRPLAIPCLLNTQPSTTCAKASYPTEDEAKETVAKWERHAQEWAAKLAANICPHCDQPITKQQVGLCVYGSCGHRLYQGKVSNG